MVTINRFFEIIQAGSTTTEKALSLFDHLESVDPDMMVGSWKGIGFPTHHFLDGLLEVSGWYGKSFQNPECVHPLLFYKANKKGIFALNTALLPLKLLHFPLPKTKMLRYIILVARVMLQTKKYKARLRMISYRDRLSAAMVYDDLPIMDVFRKIDHSTLLGMMDLKNMRQPFFFVLKRDESATQP